MAKSILIVDDSQILRRLLSHYFRSSPKSFEIHEAADGLEAVQKFPQLKPDLIVLDLAMPRMNGIETARRIKAMNTSTAVILFTMYAQEILDGRINVSGVDAVVLKPDLTALHQQVERLLPTGRLADDR
jgi:CheY-like chemotaxis protein